MAVPSPTVAGRELAARLRKRRQSLTGVTVKGIADQLGVSRNYWTLVETNRTILTEANFAKVLDILGFNDDPAEATELAELHRLARQSGWWDEHRKMYPEEVLRFFGLEHGAAAIRTFEPLVIPGLLQTADYARAVIGSDPQYSLVELDERVAIRLRRQERLRGDDPVRLSVVVSEAALRQYRGGVTVQRAQLVALAQTISELWETLEFRVVPFEADIGILAGTSTLLIVDFDSPHLGTVAWQESIRPLGVIDDADRIRRLELSWEEGKLRALDRRQSLELIERLADELALQEAPGTTDP